VPWIQLNLIQFNSWIQIELLKNGMQIDGEDIESLLANMLEKKEF
jgi:hypothetical protein